MLGRAQLTTVGVSSYPKRGACLARPTGRTALHHCAVVSRVHDYSVELPRAAPVRGTVSGVAQSLENRRLAMSVQNIPKMSKSVPYTPLHSLQCPTVFYKLPKVESSISRLKRLPCTTPVSVPPTRCVRFTRPARVQIPAKMCFEKSACPAAQGRGMFVRATRLEKGYHCREPEEDGRRSFGRRSFD